MDQEIEIKIRTEEIIESIRQARKDYRSGRVKTHDEKTVTRLLRSLSLSRLLRLLR